MKKIIASSVFLTLAATPWVSSDALIIPKIIILTSLSFFILPELLVNLKGWLSNKILLVTILVSILFIIQMIMVIIISDAPIEQQIYGRTGRGLGFLTMISLIIIFLYSVRRTSFFDLQRIFQGVLISCILSSVYSILQFFGFDFFNWRTQTNGIIGTLGNPNFQSSFIAIAFIPSIIYVWSLKYKYILTAIVSSILLFTLYICESTQGYIALASSLALFILVMLWYKSSRLIFIISFLAFFASGLIVIAGMLNKGPLSYYLYKVSVRSRVEMWDTAFSMIKDNLFFGVGLDSVGDYSLQYKSQKTVNGIDEYIDNVHNFFLQFAATGGVVFAILYTLLVLLTLYSFILIVRKRVMFEKNLAAMGAAWLSFQLQSLISPAAIPTLLWNFIISGAIIGLAVNSNLESISREVKNQKNSDSSMGMLTRTLGYLLVILALVLTIPLFNADRLAKEADTKKDALLAVRAAKAFPESVVRYNRLGAGLYESGLYDLSLDIGRSAVEFNPNSYLTWILILVNPNATYQERSEAKVKLMQIDPFNKIIKEYKF